MALTIRQLCEALVKHPKTTTKQVAPLKTLAEMDDLGGVATTMDAPPPDDAEPTDGVKEAFKAAILHIVDAAMEGETDPKEALTKIKKLLTAHGEVNGTNADGTPDADADPTTPESKPTWAAVVKECKDAGLADPAAVLIGALLDVPSPAARAIVIQNVRESAAAKEKPKSGGRQPGAPEAGRPAPAKAEPAALVWVD